MDGTGLKPRVQMDAAGFNPREKPENPEIEKDPEEEFVLPGYAAGRNESGIEHSRSKLRSSAERLSAKLEQIYCSSASPRPDTDKLSANHGSVIDRSTRSSSSSIQTFHCRNEDETWTYRCRCNFQILRVIIPDGTVAATSPTAPTRRVYRYAMRSAGNPVLLGTKNSFPIATRRIQAAMEDFMDHLNNTNRTDKNRGDDDGGFGTDQECVDNRDGEDMIGYNGHLTSCTFSSAWRDSPDSDCVLTLHYDHPLDADENSKTLWKRQAQLLCQKMLLRQLNGRSKGTLLSVKGRETLQSDEDDFRTTSDSGGEEETEATIRDTIFLLQSDDEDDTKMEDFATRRHKWAVSLEDKAPPEDSTSTVVIPVHYDKPETAFYHPNRNAMTTALSWMLNRLASIASSWSNERSPLRKPRVLEMYCGCGAHTVALGRSGLVSGILAVELDPRLVRACEANVVRNGLRDSVEVRRGDAGWWAREESRKRRGRRRRRDLAEGSSDAAAVVPEDDNDFYDVLLVDPPRQGLDEEVCRMARMTVDGESGNGEERGCFRNILYVSCGHIALLRDLERLAPVYEVVSCAQMDLFPRTDSIETLVHLRRRE